MAISRLIAPFSALSGRVDAPGAQSSTGAVVAMPDRNGRTLIRSFVTPTNPDTDWQQVARSQFTSVTEAMQSLTQDQVDSWRAVAALIQETGRLGLTYRLAWNQLFTRVNSYRVQNGQTIVATAPPFNSVALPTGIANLFSNDGAPEQQIDINLEEAFPTIPAGFLAFRFTRDLVSTARLARDNEFQYITTTEQSILPRVTAPGATYTITAERLNLFAGMRIGVEVTALTSNYYPSGRLVVRNIEVTPTP